MSFTSKILIGLGLGVATGLFAGERAEPLRLVADGFVRLLQMTVLPYVTVSLVAGIGSLDPATARKLFLRVGALVLVLWGLALGAVFLMPLAFPALESAAFFSTTLLEERAPVDFVALYIPANPFHSLANSVVPAVVLFSALLGIALMGVERKERLIEALVAAEQALAGAKELLREHGAPEAEVGSLPAVIVPAFYNFPHAAKMLSLSFVLFAAWYSETLLAAADYLRLIPAGVVSLFGSLNVSLPFLLDLVRVPADTFQLFLATGIVNSRFGTLAAAVHMVVLALAGTYALSGQLRLSGARILRYLALTAAVAAATVGGLGVALRALGGGTYEGARFAREMGLLRPPAARSTVLAELPREPLPLPREGASQRPWTRSS